MFPTQHRMFFHLAFYKCKKFSLTFCLIYISIICHNFRTRENVLDLEGTLDFVKLPYFTIEKNKIQRSLVICPRTFINCWQSRNDNLGFLITNLVCTLAFRILKISFMVKGNESNNYSLLMKY